MYVALICIDIDVHIYYSLVILQVTLQACNSFNSGSVPIVCNSDYW